MFIQYCIKEKVALPNYIYIGSYILFVIIIGYLPTTLVLLIGFLPILCVFSIKPFAWYITHLINNGKYDLAVKITKPIAKLSTITSIAYAEALLASNKAIEAKKFCENKLKTQDELLKFAILDYIAKAERKLGNLDHAISLLRSSSLMRPDSFMTLSSLALALLEKGESLEEALKLIEESIKLSLSNTSTISKKNTIIENSKRFLIKAWALLLLGREHESETEISKALPYFDKKRISDYAEQCYLAARVMLAKGDKDKAISFLEDAIKTDPKGGQGQFAKNFLEKL